MLYPTFTTLLVATTTLFTSSFAAPAPISPKPDVGSLLDSRQGFKNFVLADVYTNTFNAGLSGINNKQIAFHFTDTNSATSSVCTVQWHDPSVYSASNPYSNTNVTSPHPDTKPTGYVNCGFSYRSESFEFYFSQYKDLNNFQLQLKHTYKAYPGKAPYEYLTLFSTADIKLQCQKGTNGDEAQRGCYLPAGTVGNKIQAPVNAAVA